MSVAALPPPSFNPNPRIAMSKSRPSIQSRPSSSSSTSVLAARPSISSSSSSTQIKARPTQPAPPIIRRPSTTPTVSSSSATTPTGAAAAAGPSSKDTSSSAGKVFAKPSKEWVLPERAKPGRKVSVEEPDNKRQSQNRLSQRAHRARRTDYIQTLEERLRQYEADEIHSNVRLQEVARALKADNERLKKELNGVRNELDELTASKESWDSERRSYEELVGRLNSELNAVRGGSTKGMTAPPHLIRRQSDRPSRNSVSSPVMPTMATTERRPTIDCPICPDPDPDCPCQQSASHPSLSPSGGPTAPLAALHLAVKAMAEHDPTPTPGGNGGGGSASSCGLCQSTDECLCRVVDDVEEDVKPTIFPTPSPELDLGVSGGGSDGCGLCTSAEFCACKANAGGSGSSQSPMSVTTTTFTTTASVYPTPPSSVALPLRLRRDRPAMSTPIWSLDQPPKVTVTTQAQHNGVTVSNGNGNDDAQCSGDPSNCAACRDDSFGQEFCANIFEKPDAPPVGTHNHKDCVDCPGNCMSIKSLLCDDSAESQNDTTRTRKPTLPDMEDLALATDQETMTFDQAWKALKAHPHSRFASLSLLADVVAGRTKCSNERVELSPHPETQSHHSLPSSPARRSSPAPANTTLAHAHSHSHPHAHPHPHASSLSREISAAPSPGSGADGTSYKRRNMAAETIAVRHALRLLDSTPAPGSPGPSASGVEHDDERDAKRRRVEL